MVGFRKGWSGSPFHTGYPGNEGMDPGDAQKPGEMGPRIGGGVLAERVKMEVQRDGGKLAKGKSSKRGEAE